MIINFVELDPPEENDRGWYIRVAANTISNHFLYKDAAVHFGVAAPDPCAGYYESKTAAYLASINYYVKYGRDYPHEIFGAVSQSTNQSTTMEFE